MPLSASKRVRTSPTKKVRTSTAKRVRKKATVFSSQRTVPSPNVKIPRGIKLNTRLKMEGLQFLKKWPSEISPVVFFDPQYRGILDKMSYGNEGKTKEKKRSQLRQMSEEVIAGFIKEIDRVLIPSGHLFLWMDKFHLCQGFSAWLKGSALSTVDMIVWNKERVGMGYRSRRVCEYLVVLQKHPKKAKGIWKLHNIPDNWSERIADNGDKNPHKKPVGLQAELITAVSNKGDIVIDPAAGSFSVMESALFVNRNFAGCDVNG